MAARHPHPPSRETIKSRRRNSKEHVCSLRRSSCLARPSTGAVLLGWGDIAGKRAAFAHNPMTSLTRESFEKDTLNALSIPPSRRRFEGLLDVFQRTNPAEAEGTEAHTSTRLPADPYWRIIARPCCLGALPRFFLFRALVTE